MLTVFGQRSGDKKFIIKVCCLLRKLQAIARYTMVIFFGRDWKELSRLAESARIPGIKENTLV